MRSAAVPALFLFAAVTTASVASCSLGSGSSGAISGTLNVPSCWIGNYDLYPDFFAATPYLKTLELRIQKGGDYETFSDGVEILVDDTSTIIPNEYGRALTVSPPSGVTPVGVPLAANPNPSIVHLSLYLQATCQIQDVALYALDSVSLGPSGECEFGDAGPMLACAGSATGLADAGTDAGDAATSASDAATSDAGNGSSDAGGNEAGGAEAGATEAGTSALPVGHSTITFNALYDGNPDAVSATERLNDGFFDVYLADPREACPGGLGPPPPCRGHLTGHFTFYFQRGRPAQPFP